MKNTLWGLIVPLVLVLMIAVVVGVGVMSPAVHAQSRWGYVCSTDYNQIVRTLSNASEVIVAEMPHAQSSSAFTVSNKVCVLYRN